jgi:hypothetical protein
VTDPTAESAASGRRSTVAVIVGAIVVLAALAIVAVVLLNRSNHRPGTGEEALPTVGVTDTPTAPPDTSPPSAAPTGAVASAGATRSPAVRTTAPKPPPGCPNCQMTGDNIVYHVGGTGPKTARAGTWHGDGGTDCLWTISTDPAGVHVISQKQALGPTDLLLRADTYFQSAGCQPWNWVGAA